MKKAIFIFIVLMMAMIVTSASAETVTISGPNSVWDSTLRGDWANANIGQNGTDRQWRIFSDSESVQRHNLMQFDLSGIPVGAIINSATMGIYIRRYGNVADITGYQISRLQDGMTWAEGATAYSDPAVAGDSTWNSRVHGSTLWQTAGATGDADIDKTTSISWDLAGGTVDPGFVNFNLKGFVQDWVNGTWENNGILFWGGSGGSAGAYNWGYLSEASGVTEATRVPYLIVDYTVAAVPEPSSLAALAMFGLGSFGFIKRRRA